jgi:hypothetical protein
LPGQKLGFLHFDRPARARTRIGAIKSAHGSLHRFEILAAPNLSLRFHRRTEDSICSTMQFFRQPGRAAGYRKDSLYQQALKVEAHWS